MTTQLIALEREILERNVIDKTLLIRHQILLELAEMTPITRKLLGVISEFRSNFETPGRYNYDIEGLTIEYFELLKLRSR